MIHSTPVRGHRQAAGVTITIPSHMSKAAISARMTDAEHQIYKLIRGDFPERMGAIFDLANYISTDDPFYPALFDAASSGHPNCSPQAKLNP